jgi:hypothetical protein
MGQYLPSVSLTLALLAPPVVQGACAPSSSRFSTALDASMSPAIAKQAFSVAML